MGPHPLERVSTGPGQSQVRVAEEADRLRGMDRAELEAEAKAVGVAAFRRRDAAKNDDLRLAILEVKIADVLS